MGGGRGDGGWGVGLWGVVGGSRGGRGEAPSHGEVMRRLGGSRGISSCVFLVGI